jgi:hypothetical protein
MSKHPLDHGHDGSSARLDKFTEVERAKKPSDAAKALQQRVKDEADSRLEKFTKIERGAKE